MTDKEYSVERDRLDVQSSQSRLREAERNLEEGIRKTKAQVEQAQSDADKEVAKLIEEVTRAKLDVERMKKCLELSETNLARGFDVN